MLTLARTTITIALLLVLMLIGTIIGARAQTAAPRQAAQTQQLWAGHTSATATMRSRSMTALAVTAATRTASFPNGCDGC